MVELTLKNKVAIVTGSIQGIGLETARWLSKAGASVVINSRRDGVLLEQRAEEIRKQGGKARAVLADVSNKEEAKQLVDAALELGGVDILVNNAGGLVQRVPVSEFDLDHYQKVLDANVKSAFLMSHLVMPVMKEKKSGKIINMSSQSAHNGGGVGAAVYASSKGAVWTLTKALAKELAPFGVMVNCVSPGLILNTAFHDTFTSIEVQERIVKNIPLGRGGSSEDVAKVILFLASDLSDYMTGQSLEINGGLYMQ